MTGGTPDNLSCLASAELYDPKTRTFSLTGKMGSARCGHTATPLADGRVLIAGGAGDWAGHVLRTSAELYDPETGTFSPTGSLSIARSEQTATLLAGGRVLVAGGGGDSIGDGLASAEIYDPKRGTFSLTGPMTTPRVVDTATLLSDGRVLVTGGSFGNGWDMGGPFVASAELYDPKTGTFGRAH